MAETELLLYCSVILLTLEKVSLSIGKYNPVAVTKHYITTSYREWVLEKFSPWYFRERVM